MGNQNLKFHKNSVFISSACDGQAEETVECNAVACISSDCSRFPGILSPEFYGFSGKPAISVADCGWDWFGCTKKAGSWPKNEKCCKKRFDMCCLAVMRKT